MNPTSRRRGSRPYARGTNSFSNAPGKPRHGSSGRPSFRKNRNISGGFSSFGGGRNRFHSAPRGNFRRGPSKRSVSSFDPSRFINKEVTQAAPVKHEIKHTFADFKLDERILANLAAANLISPTPIQDQIIPHILEGRDVVGLSNTGTGKTAAFLLPLMNRTLRDGSMQTIILAPTRELAIQIEDEVKKLGRGLRLFSTVCVGGAPIGPQMRSLRRPNHFIIGTPGRVKDLIERRALRLDKTRAVVLDEADRMLDMGFIHDMREILSHVPEDRHTLCFSATMSKPIEAIIRDFLKDPVTISARVQDITTNIAQDVVRLNGRDKFDVLVDLLSQKDFNRVIVFGRTKHGVEKLARMLSGRGVRADSIHGNKSHNQRQRALQRFRDAQVTALIATDVAARGLHIHDVSHVINYDLPATYEDYVHRIGRTGRGEKTGQALTFVG